MSPLLFLAIPLVTFVVGSSLLYLFNRWNRGSVHYHKAPEDLRMLAPMLKEQREQNWPVGTGYSSRR